MLKHMLATALLGSGLLAGCVIPSALSGGSGEVTLTLRPEIQPGQLAYRTQNAGTYAYTRNTIDHVVLKLFTVDALSQEATVSVTRNGSLVPLTATLTGSQIDQEFAFTKLHHETRYRVRAFAYDAASNLISVDERSTKDILVDHETSLEPQRIPLVLKDRLFSGTASSSLEVTNGGISYEDITFGLNQLTLRATGTWDMLAATPTLSLNGQPWTGTSSTEYLASASVGVLSVVFANDSSEYLAILNHDNSSESGSVPPGATTSVQVTVGHAPVHLDIIVNSP